MGNRMAETDADSASTAFRGQEMTPVAPVDVIYEAFNPGSHMQRLLSVKQVAHWLRRTEGAVTQDAETGDLPGRMIDGEWRFGAAAVNRWLEGEHAALAGDVFADTIQPLLTEIGALRRAVEATNALAARRGDDGRVVPAGQAIDFQLSQQLTLAELEEAYIRYVLRQCGENKTNAAKWLGIDPSTLHRKLALFADAP